LAITNRLNQNNVTTLRALEQIPKIFLTTEIMGGTFDILAIVLVKDLASITSLI